jgi:hypothetical protein
MAEDRPEPEGPSPDPARPKRTPPTIDLQATEMSSATAKASAEAQSGPGPEPEPAIEPEPKPELSPETASAAQDSVPPAQPVSRPISPWVVAPVSGAVAAALVIAVGWLLGWPVVQPAPVAAPQANAAIDELNIRVAGLESKVGKPAADPTAAARTEALEKSVTALRGELAGQRAQSDKLAADVKAAPRAGAAPDLAAVNARIDKIENAVQTQRAEIAKQDSAVAGAKPADDVPLRRVVAASLLDVAVRHGDAYAAPLAAAKSYADDVDGLKPLDAFAEKGVPNPNALCRELLEIVPKLSPPAPGPATAGTGIVDRLSAGAAKLVRIERTDAAGTDRGSVVARITAAALRNDFADARRELKAMPPAERAAAQAWLDTTDTREAALAASRKFADNAMAALAKAGQ